MTITELENLRARIFGITLKELEALRDFVRSVPAGTQHDFFGGDTPGACAADCVKCRAEALIKELEL